MQFLRMHEKLCILYQWTMSAVTGMTIVSLNIHSVEIAAGIYILTQYHYPRLSTHAKSVMCATA